MIKGQDKGLNSSSQFAPSITALIERFKSDDLDLKLAIENEDENSISLASQKLENSLKNILEYECTSRSECKLMCDFLISKFVVVTDPNSEILKRVCSKILTLI